ncbi:helix-turn-helix transcriptional regulator [Neobacillus novalis]|uniref:Helix-turn-helix transcriptional regulator n=1 Tax=Neobacillus novalis TaxID=220687 RepID=A0AA95ML92_9BACI|nr:helix-turn-helix transcriptional regulator [Neobacillus novalis]WHY86047.1 helix-turn-helix transcriptional regulator [Neobacillus novalis]
MDNHKISTVGMLIEQKRRTKNLMQDELAFNCNISRKAISNIETDKNLPSLPLLVKIARELDIEGYELLKEIEERGLLEDYLRKYDNNNDNEL